MQPDTITLAVDELNNDTLVDHPMTRVDYTNSRSKYIGATHSAINRDEMSLFRSAAKASGNFRGVEKTSVKLTKDQSVPGADGVTTLTIPAIGECSFSLPIGMSSANKLLLRQCLVAAVDHAFMVALQDQLVI